MRSVVCIILMQSVGYLGSTNGSVMLFGSGLGIIEFALWDLVFSFFFPEFF